MGNYIYTLCCRQNYEEVEMLPCKSFQELKIQDIFHLIVRKKELD